MQKIINKKFGAILLILLFIVCTLPFFIKPIYALDIFSDNFETGNLNNWNISTPANYYVTITNQVAYEGRYSANLTGDGLAGDRGRLIKNFTTKYDELYFRVQFQFNVLPDNLKRYGIVNFGDNAYWGYRTRFQLDRNDTFGGYRWRFYLQDDGGGANIVGYSSLFTPSINQWYDIQGYRKRASSPVANDGECRMYVDGSQVISITGLDIRTVGQTNEFHCMVWHSGVSTVQQFFDNVRISTSYIHEYWSSSQTYNQIAYGSGISFRVFNNLAFQNSIEELIYLSINSGVLNCSDGQLNIYDGGGSFRFTALNDTQITIMYSVDQLKVQGDQNNTLRPFPSGNSITVQTGNNIFITWSVTLKPLLPLMFILGLFGLCSIIGGSLYTIDRIKKHDAYNGLTNGVIIVAFGISLFLAWLWSGVTV